MKLCSKIFAIAIATATTYSLIGCAAPPSFSYQNVNVTLSSRCVDCQGGQGSGDNIIFNPAQPGVELMPNAGEGGEVLLTANVTNAAPNVSWAVYPTNDLTQPSPLPTGSSQPVGESSPAGQTGYIIVESGNTAMYTNGGINIHSVSYNSSIPYYTGALLTQANNMKYTITYQVPSVSLSGVPGYTTIVDQMTGIPQGDVLIAASVPNDPNNPSSVTTGYQLMQYYNENNATPTLYLVPQTPTNPSSLTTSVLTVPRGTSYQFYGGAIGAPPCIAAVAGGLCSNGSPDYSVDNTVVWEVGASTATAVPGGSTTYGTISATGLYTAPLAVPPTQPVIVMASHLAPALADYAYITID